MNKNTEGRVKVTDEYNLFSFANGNRGINPKHVKELRHSIESIGVIPSPIIVNEKMEIIDGQHRFEACRMLNKPVYYLVIAGTTMKHAAAMNANNKSWRLEDFLDYYVNEGLPDYVFVKRMTNLSSLSLAMILRILGIQDMDSFRNGTARFTGDESEELKLIMWIEKYAPYVKNMRGRKASLYGALAWIKRNMDFDEERLMSAVENIIIDNVDVVDTTKAMVAIEERYNYRLGKDNKRYFAHEYEKRK